MKIWFRLLFTIVFIINVKSSIAVDKYWDGGGTSDNWNNSANWDNNTLPSAGDDVFIAIGSSLYVDVNVTINSLTFYGGGSSSLTLAVNFNRTLTVTNGITLAHSVPLPTALGEVIITGDGTINCSSVTINATTGSLSSNTLSSISTDLYNFNISGDLNLNSHTDSPYSDNVIFLIDANTVSIGGSININEESGSDVSFLMNGTATAILHLTGATPIGVISGSPTFNVNGTGAQVHYSGSSQSVGATAYNRLILSGSSVKTLTGNTTITDYLRIEGSATFDDGGYSLTYNTDATLWYKGSVPQTTSDNEFPSINKPTDIRITNPDGVTLHEIRTIEGQLFVESGVLNTSLTNLMIIGPNGTATANSQGFVNGPLAHTVETAAFTSKNYPIGKGSSKRSVGLGITQSDLTSRRYVVEIYNSPPVSRTLPSSLSAVSSVRHIKVWQIPAGTLTTAWINIEFDTDDYVTDPSNLRIAKENGTDWEDLGGQINGSSSDLIRSTVNFTTFSDFVLANATGGSNPLPVELTFFKASVDGWSVQLNWETAAEVNNYGFEVERSTDKSSWSKIAFIAGHGNSNSMKQYSFTDIKVSSGKYYYRLKQIDNTGIFDYSKEIEVTIEKVIKDFTVEPNFPNPFNPTTTIKFGFQESVDATVVIYNSLGSKVAVLFNERTEAGKIYNLDFNGSQLTSGVYYYVVRGGNFKSVKKMILMK